MNEESYSRGYKSLSNWCNATNYYFQNALRQKCKFVPGLVFMIVDLILLHWNATPSHPTIQILNCSLIFILPALPTCLLLEFDVFRPGKSNNLSLKTCRISLVPRPLAILSRYVVDSPLITSSVDSWQAVQTDKGWREVLGTGWVGPRTYLSDPNTTSENLEFFVLEWKLEQCCSQG